MKKVIFGERTRKQVGEAFGPWSQGIEAKGTLIFVAGQVALAEGEIVGKGDMGVQYTHIMENIKAILEDAGASMDDIVKFAHYVVPKVTPESAEFATIVKIRKQYIKKDFPIGTMIQVAGLMLDDALVEVDAIAVKD